MPALKLTKNTPFLNLVTFKGCPHTSGLFYLRLEHLRPQAAKRLGLGDGSQLG
jgi:hypothetical protein